MAGSGWAEISKAAEGPAIAHVEADVPAESGNRPLDVRDRTASAIDEIGVPERR